MTDEYTPATKRYHFYIQSWLKNDRQKYEKRMKRSREHARKKRETIKRSVKNNNMKPIEVGVNVHE